MINGEFFDAKTGMIQFTICSIVFLVFDLLEKKLIVKLPNQIGNEMVKDLIIRATHEDLASLYKKERVSSLFAINNMTYFVPFYYIVELPEMIIAIIKGLGALLLLGTINWTIAFALIVVAFLQYWISTKIYDKRSDAEVAFQTVDNSFKEDIIKRLNKYSYILAHSMQGKMISRIEEESNSVINSIKKSILWKNVEATEESLFYNIQYLGCVFFVLMLVHNGSFHIGEYEAIIGYAAIMLECIQMIFETIGVRQMMIAMVDVYKKSEGNIEENGIFFENSLKEVRLNNVSFSFGDNKVIKNKTLSFIKGKLYVIEGSNGAGKSTLLNLITGLFRADEGTVYVNDRPIQEWNKYRYLAENISITDQKTQVFCDNLFEEITGEETDKDIDQAAWNEVLSIPEFKDLLERNSMEGFSGGELQKIGLARFLYRLKKNNSSLLILDEPTNHLDKESVSFLLSKLEEIKSDHIVIVVSHSKEVLNYADEVVRLRPSMT
ncbi:MAG: ATP-binding cassette domain-containing protein [Lachnospiraceae bacterium]|nr:ATP-binding cassette domain-containing protein [Lachnospiraceae bacterium]